MAHNKKHSTRLEILQYATKLFLTEGYTATFASTISKELDISPGNLTYHFPTKEHLLLELTENLCNYHNLVMEQEINEGITTLLAYLLELTSMISICEESAVAKDLYTAIYTHSHTLELIRKYETKKTKMVFLKFCPNFNDIDFVKAENIVSGIEYSSLMNENTEDISPKERISSVLDSVMKIYNVPENLRKLKIEKVLDMDYKKIGRRFIEGFIQYVEEINLKAIEEK